MRPCFAFLFIASYFVAVSVIVAVFVTVNIILKLSYARVTNWVIYCHQRNKQPSCKFKKNIEKYEQIVFSVKRVHKENRLMAPIIFSYDKILAKASHSAGWYPSACGQIVLEAWLSVICFSSTYQQITTICR